MLRCLQFFARVYENDENIKLSFRRIHVHSSLTQKILKETNLKL